MGKAAGIPLLMPTDPEFQAYKKFFEKKDGFGGSVPVQIKIGPEKFHNEFSILYQVSKEDSTGELFDFRVFFRDTNGLKVQQWISDFNKYFCHKVIDAFKTNAPKMQIFHGEAIQIANQLDFFVLGVPGRYIEEVLDRYFKLLNSKI